MIKVRIVNSVKIKQGQRIIDQLIELLNRTCSMQCILALVAVGEMHIGPVDFLFHRHVLARTLSYLWAF